MASSSASSRPSRQTRSHSSSTSGRSVSCEKETRQVNIHTGCTRDGNRALLNRYVRDWEFTADVLAGAYLRLLGAAALLELGQFAVQRLSLLIQSTPQTLLPLGEILLESNEPLLLLVQRAPLAVHLLDELRLERVRRRARRPCPAPVAHVLLNAKIVSLINKLNKSVLYKFNCNTSKQIHATETVSCGMEWILLIQGTKSHDCNPRKFDMHSKIERDV